MVYIHLKKKGVAVVGDKLKYGSETDKLAARGEALFQKLVPFAEDQNKIKFQSKIDFKIGNLNIDVKTSTAKNNRYSFSLKKQELLADFFVLFGYLNDEPRHAFLIPHEVMKNYQTISLSFSAKGKWWDYEIDMNDINSFFKEVAAA